MPTPSSLSSEATDSDPSTPGTVSSDSSPTGTQPQPRPLLPLAKPLRLGLRIFAASAVGTAATNAAIILFLTMAWSGQIGDSMLDPLGFGLDLAALVFIVVFLISYIFCVVMTCRWTFRAMKNLTLVGLAGTTSPGWAVGWYFIPFANLWMPFKATQDIWHGSLGGDTSTRLLGVWWALWIIANIVSNGANRVFGLEPELNVLRLSLGIDAVTSLMLAVAAFALGRIVVRVADAQDGGFANPLIKVFS